MQRGTPIQMSLPPFQGTVRRLVLWYVVIYFSLLLLNFAMPERAAYVMGMLALIPVGIFHHGWVWQLVTYTFVPSGILNTVFALLALWFTGAILESVRGGRWLLELFYVSVVGGGLLAAALAMFHVLGMSPVVPALGPWSAVFGMLVAYSTLFADQEMLFFFVIRIKAKYLIAIYVLIEIAMLLRGEDRFSAAVQLCSGLCAWLFLKFAPARGLAFAASEQAYGARNAYFRWKRRRAARKFQVYMRKQDRVVEFDDEGRYIPPDENRTRISDKDQKGPWVN